MNDFIIEYCKASENQASREQIDTLREQAKQTSNQGFAELLERVADALEHGESIGTAIEMLLSYKG